jgi:hypothetical protein
MYCAVSRGLLEPLGSFPVVGGGELFPLFRVVQKTEEVTGTVSEAKKQLWPEKYNSVLRPRNGPERSFVDPSKVVDRAIGVSGVVVLGQRKLEVVASTCH